MVIQGFSQVNSNLSELKRLYGTQHKPYEGHTGTESNDSTNEYRARDELTSETQLSYNDKSNQEDQVKQLKRQVQKLQNSNRQLETDVQKARQENDVMAKHLEMTASHSNQLEVDIRKLRQSKEGNEQNKTIMDEYRRLSEDYQECEARLASATKELDNSRDKINELNDELSLLRQQQRENGKGDDESNQMALQEAAEKIESLEQRNNEKDQLIQQYERNINNYRAQIQSLEQRPSGFSSQTHDGMEEELYQRLNTSKLSISQELYDTASALNNLASDVAKKEDEIRKLESQRTDTRSRLADALDYNKHVEQKVQELQHLLRQQDMTNSEYNKLQEAYAQANKHIQDLEFELKDKDDQHQQEQQMADNKIQKLESRHNVLKEKAMDAEAKLNDANEDYSRLEQTKLDMEQYQSQIKHELKKAQTETRQLRNQIQVKQHEVTQLQSNLDHVQGQLDEQIKTMRSLEQEVNRMNSVENQIQERSERISYLETILEAIRKDLNDATRAKVETEEMCKRLESDLDDLTRHFQGKQNAMGLLERENQQLKREIEHNKRVMEIIQDSLDQAMKDKEKKGN